MDVELSGYKQSYLGESSRDCYPTITMMDFATVTELLHHNLSLDRWILPCAHSSTRFPCATWKSETDNVSATMLFDHAIYNYSSTLIIVHSIQVPPSSNRRWQYDPYISRLQQWEWSTFQKYCQNTNHASIEKRWLNTDNIKIWCMKLTDFYQPDELVTTLMNFGHTCSWFRVASQPHAPEADTLGSTCCLRLVKLRMYK